MIRFAASSNRRHFVIGEIKGNLVADERKELLKNFQAPCYKKIASVTVGAAPKAFVKAQKDSIVAEKERQRKERVL